MARSDSEYQLIYPLQYPENENIRAQISDSKNVCELCFLNTLQICYYTNILHTPRKNMTFEATNKLRQREQPCSLCKANKLN